MAFSRIPLLVVGTLLVVPVFRPSEPVYAEVLISPAYSTPGRSRDREITRIIREELQSEGELSPYGKNVKIVTLQGIVTLRGPVTSEVERIKIETIAKSVAGTQTVKNQLRVR